MLRRRLSASTLALALLPVLGLAGGCTDTAAIDTAARLAAEDLSAALGRLDLRPVAFADVSGEQADQELRPLVRGMGPIRPRVSVAEVERNGDRATARLSFTWTFPGVPGGWTYETSATVQRTGDQWKPEWAPAIVQPDLDGHHRLSQHRIHPRRGELLGEDGAPIVMERPVFRIGLDKAELTASRADDGAVRDAARRLARLVGIDPERYAGKVRGSGPEAFVEAIVVRRDADNLPLGSAIRAIPGALSISDVRMLAANRDFARPLIGAVGEATKEIVDASGGTVVSGDQVGVSGLQARYDDRMRGTPGVQVRLVPLGTQPSAAPGPTPTETPSVAAPPRGGTPTPPSAAPTPDGVRTLYQVAAVTGQPLTTTLNIDLQSLAERTLAGVAPASALVAIRPSTGAIVALASGPGAKGQSVASVGHYAPGSTFKVATSLALLRAGLTPDAAVACPPTITVDGRRFRNYSDYPSTNLGSISLTTALAQSCNTAFIGERDAIDPGELVRAASSLGLGTDYDVGFASFFGAVPADAKGTAAAAAMIGQGTVQASPLSMSAVVASVAAGHTVVPHVVAGRRARSVATPLTAAEARHLRAMMRAVVTDGSGRQLAGLAGPQVIAKTGTAEFGSSRPLKTHAWMIAAQGDLAVAVFVADGETGSRTAGPLMKRFLSGAR